MVTVTDKEYYMTDILYEKLKLMEKRSTGKGTSDNVTLIDGDEGTGKTNFAFGYCYAYASMTGRKFSLDNLYFDLDKLMDDAIKTEEGVFLWDEGALGGLASEWWTKNQIKFVKLLMVARKKRHFIVICIPKFFKLNEYLVVDRSIALVHIYARQNTKKGYFFYYTKANKERLFYDWRRTKMRNYSKYKSFHGTFPAVEDILFDSKEYNKRKDQAILSLGHDPRKSEALTKKQQKEWIKINTLRWKLSQLPKKINISQADLAKAMGVDTKRLREWAKIDINDPIALAKPDLGAAEGSTLLTNAMERDDNDKGDQEEGSFPAIISSKPPKDDSDDFSAGQIN